jgi:hypothetical protein
MMDNRALKVKDLLVMLEGWDPESTVSIHCDGGLYGTSLFGTEDMNDGSEPSDFVIHADTT